MRFNIRKKPQIDQEREVYVFAWVPIRVEDCVVWLEFYLRREKFDFSFDLKIKPTWRCMSKRLATAEDGFDSYNEYN